MSAKRIYIIFNLAVLISVLMLSCKQSEKTEFNTENLNKIPHSINYERNYDGHLQGMATDFEKFIYWSHTMQLAKTDLNGKVLKVINVSNHHGDLEYYKGKIYVAVNFGKFNEEPGLADSWIYVYDAENMDFIQKYPVPEVVHGAGGIAIHNNQVMVVGGLPDNGKYNQNFIYEFDLSFNFKKRHELAGGFTYKGIQTACYFDGQWYFACYGSTEKGYFPKVLKVNHTAENKMKLTQIFDLDMSYGMIGLNENEFLYSQKSLDKKAVRKTLPLLNE